MKTFLKVWHILKYCPGCRGGSMPPAESHHASHQNLSALQSLLILAVQVRLISTADSWLPPAAECEETPASPLWNTSPRRYSLREYLIAAEGAHASSLSWAAGFRQWKWGGRNTTLNLHWRKVFRKTWIKKGWFFQCEESKNKITF